MLYISVVVSFLIMFSWCIQEMHSECDILREIWQRTLTREMDGSDGRDQAKVLIQKLLIIILHCFSIS